MSNLFPICKLESENGQGIEFLPLIVVGVLDPAAKVGAFGSPSSIVRFPLRRLVSASNFLKELAKAHFQRTGNFLQSPSANLFVSVFQFRQVLARDRGMTSKDVLGPFAFCP
jgi:hypothetical protein